MSLPCGFCGWLELNENEDGTLDCRECCLEWKSRDVYLSDLRDFVQQAWESEDKFMRSLMRPPTTEKKIRHLASGLLALQADPALIESILHAANDSSKAPLASGEIGVILLEMAATE